MTAPTPRSFSTLTVAVMVAALVVAPADAEQLPHQPAAGPAGLGLDVEKEVSVDGMVSWADADDPTGPEVTAGADVFFRLTVTNTGGIDLSGLEVTDPDLTDIDTTCAFPDTLAAGAGASCVLGPCPAEYGQHTNTATATAGSGVVPLPHEYQNKRRSFSGPPYG